MDLKHYVVGRSRKYNHENLYNLYPLSYIIRMTESMRMRSVEHVARTRETSCKAVKEKPERKS